MAIPVLDTKKFDRNFCALVTPYKSDGLEIDEDAFRELVRYFTRSADFLKTGGALIAVPEAGEVFYLTQEERNRLIKIALQERPGDMPIFSGYYGVRREECIESAMSAKKVGVDGLLVLPPAGTMEVSTAIDGVGNPEIWTNHVKALAEPLQLPLIIHAAAPWNSEWGGGLPIPTVKMMLEAIPSIVGWKMISGNYGAHFRVANFLRSFPRHVGILNAPHYAEHTARLLNLVDGAVSGGYNYLKEPTIEHDLAWKAGDLEKVKTIFAEQIVPIQNYIVTYSGRLHIRYKLATWIRGLIPHPFMRPPMPPPRKDEAENIYRLISDAGLTHITRSEFERVLAQREAILGQALVVNQSEYSRH